MIVAHGMRHNPARRSGRSQFQVPVHRNGENWPCGFGEGNPQHAIVRSQRLDSHNPAPGADFLSLGRALLGFQLDVDRLTPRERPVNTDAHPVTTHIHSRAGYMRYSTFHADDHGLAPDRYPSRGTALPDGRIRSDRHRKNSAP